jgi:hypothetical protein
LETDHKKAYRRFILIYHSIAILLFLGFGLFILFSPKEIMTMNRQYKTGFGILLVLYSLYRAFKAYRRFKYEQLNTREEFEDED